jgi:hypothetical protein
MAESASRIAFKEGLRLMEDVPTYRFKVTQAVADVYWMALELYDADVLRKAFAKAIREEKDLPSPATLVKHARAVRAEAQPRPPESFNWPTKEQSEEIQKELAEKRRQWNRQSREATRGQP